MSQRYVAAVCRTGISHLHIAPAESQRHIAAALFEELEQNVQQQKCLEFDFVQVCL
jgi:hypothetical protein